MARTKVVKRRPPGFHCLRTALRCPAKDKVRVQVWMDKRIMDKIDRWAEKNQMHRADAVRALLTAQVNQGLPSSLLNLLETI